jgi:hypothetical protein
LIVIATPSAFLALFLQQWLLFSPPTSGLSWVKLQASFLKGGLVSLKRKRYLHSLSLEGRGKSNKALALVARVRVRKVVAGCC